MYGSVRIGQMDGLRAVAPQLEIGIVQPNLAFGMKEPDRQAFAQRPLRDLQTQSHLLEGEGAELRRPA
ncbi:MAG: hypothetical protein IPP90_21445 [Gemmatimonadaceae bacterium]|nr:hypothetical protein [Gemmatimonadaceae bacterium]